MARGFKNLQPFATLPSLSQLPHGALVHKSHEFYLPKRTPPGLLFQPPLSELLSRPFILLICTTAFTHLLTSPLSLSPTRPIFTLLPEHFSKMVRLCRSYYFKISSGSPQSTGQRLAVRITNSAPTLISYHVST